MSYDPVVYNLVKVIIAITVLKPRGDTPMRKIKLYMYSYALVYAQPKIRHHMTGADGMVRGGGGSGAVYGVFTQNVWIRRFFNKK